MRGCLAATRVHCLLRHNVAAASVVVVVIIIIIVVVVVAVCAILFVCYLRYSWAALYKSPCTFNYTFSNETTSHIAEVIQKPQVRPATTTLTTLQQKQELATLRRFHKRLSHGQSKHEERERMREWATLGSWIALNCQKKLNELRQLRHLTLHQNL